MILSAMLLVSSLTLQNQITDFVKSNPKFVGKITTICVDNDCVTVDRSKDVINRLDKAPKDMEDTPAMPQVLGKVLESIGGTMGVSGSVSVEYKETTKSENGDEHSMEVKVEIKGGTGTGAQ